MLTTLVRRSLAHNRRITLWTLATLTACAALLVVFTTIAVDVGRGMSRALRTLGANAVAYGGTNDTIRTEDPATRWFPLETALGPSGGEMLALSLRPGLLRGAPVGVVAADPAMLARMTPYWVVEGSRPGGSEGCLVGRKAADFFDLTVGARAELAFADGTRREVRVDGIFESGDDDEDRIFVASAAESLWVDAVPYALLSVPGGEGPIDGIASDRGVKGAGIAVKPLRQIVRGEENVLAKITLLCALGLGVVVVLSSLGVTASVWARVVERRREFALLQALGATRRAVTRFLLAESAALAILAAGIGFLLGTLVSRAIVRDIFGVPATPHVAAFAAGLAGTLLVSTAAGVAGVWRTRKLLPAAALRDE